MTIWTKQNQWQKDGNLNEIKKIQDSGNNMRKK